MMVTTATAVTGKKKRDDDDDVDENGEKKRRTTAGKHMPIIMTPSFVTTDNQALCKNNKEQLCWVK